MTNRTWPLITYQYCPYTPTVDPFELAYLFFVVSATTGGLERRRPHRGRNRHRRHRRRCLLRIRLRLRFRLILQPRHTRCCLREFLCFGSSVFRTKRWSKASSAAAVSSTATYSTVFLRRTLSPLIIAQADRNYGGALGPTHFWPPCIALRLQQAYAASLGIEQI